VVSRCGYGLLSTELMTNHKSDYEITKRPCQGATDRRSRRRAARFADAFVSTDGPSLGAAILSPFGERQRGGPPLPATVVIVIWPRDAGRSFGRPSIV